MDLPGLDIYCVNAPLAGRDINCIAWWNGDILRVTFDGNGAKEVTGMVVEDCECIGASYPELVTTSTGEV